MADESRLVLVGRIAGAFGVKGEVRLHSFTTEPDGIVSYGPLLGEDGAVVLTPKRAHAIKDGIAVTAPEIKTREDAEALKGTKLYVPRDALPAPEEDEFYAIDLVGCTVEDLAGAPLGTVKAIHDFGAGDILEITNAGGSWFLPFTAENAPRIDLQTRKIVTDPPPDLLESGKET